MFPVLQIPGGIELLVVFFIAVLLFGIPLAVIALLVVLVRGSRGDGDVDEEVAALREEVAELRATIQAGAEDVETGAVGDEDTDDARAEGGEDADEK